MARVNIAEWSSYQVAEWLKGLDPAIAKYIHLFVEKGIRGQQILNLRGDDLENIGVVAIGHQEIILEAVEHLRNYHYEADRENLQQLAMRVSCAATCLFRRIRGEDKIANTQTDTGVDTRTLSEVADVLTTIRPLIYWFDTCGMQTGGVAARRALLLQLSVEMATNAHLDRFSVRPRHTVRINAQRLSALADYIIQEVSDPIILQPSSVKEVLLCLNSSRDGSANGKCPSRRADLQVGETHLGASCHRVSAVRFGSPAHTTNIRPGDEIVQIGQSVVVGWTLDSVRERLASSCTSADAALTLRRRPSPPLPPTHVRTLKVGCKVKELDSLDSRNCIEEEEAGSPATPTTPTTPTLPPLNLQLNPALNNITNISNLSTECLRIYFPKPRPLVQRRNTIGGSTVSLPSRSDISYRVETKSVTFKEVTVDDESMSVRDDNSLTAKKKWRSDKSVSTPAYDFNETDHPASDNRETGTILNRLINKTADESNLVDKHIANFGEVTKPDSLPALETINMTLAERRKLFFETTDSPTKIVSEAINKVVVPDAVIAVEDVPPEPPPRPLATQSPHLISALNSINKCQKESRLPVAAGRVLTPKINLPRSSSGSSPMDTNPPIADSSVPNSLPSPTTNLQRLISESKTSLNSSISPRLTPSGVGVVRGIFTTNKSRSLKKKNSILSKRRKVPAKDVGPGEMQGVLYQRCRTKTNSTVTWYQKWYILTGNTFYGYKNKDATKADCLIFLSGFTVASAPEVKSKDFAFKVYHTGTFFYFAGVDTDATNAWIDHISKATLLNNDSWERASKKDRKTDESKHFSETDYSDEETPNGKSPKSGNGKLDAGKEKSIKFGSLKKFTNKIHKTESHENVNHSATSLDRSYLRFFSTKSSKSKNYKTLKSNNVPVPTPQYKTYKRPPTQPANSEEATVPPEANSDEDINQMAKISKIEPIDTKCKLPKQTNKSYRKIPSPINYIHASNPNLLVFESNDFAIKPTAPVAFKKIIVQRPDNFIGFITLEQFMLNKQEEERRQVYSNRVLLGIESSTRHKEHNLQEQLDNIVPDVIYGEQAEYSENGVITLEQIQSRTLPKTPDEVRSEKFHKDNPQPLPPISGKIKDGYEKIDYDDDSNFDIKVEKVTVEITTPKDKSGKMSSCSLSTKEKSDSTGPNHIVSSTKYIRKFSLSEAKELGYEVLYGDNSLCTPKMPQRRTSKDLGYETIFDNSESASRCSLTSLQTDDSSISQMRCGSEDSKPKIMPKSKQVLNKQKSIVSSPGNRSSSDKLPIFKQGDSPEKFWLDSLRRNDRVFDRTIDSVKSEKFFTKHTEPSTLMSSEATIVKSEQMQSKGAEVERANQPTKSPRRADTPMKSVAQYTPMSLPLISSNKALKTSPQFEMSLDSKEPVQASSSGVKSGITRLRLMFTASPTGSTHSTASSPGVGGKEKTLLGSPRLHRAIFRKQQSSHTPTDDFTYTKIYATENSSQSDKLGVSPSESLLTISSCETSNLSNMSTPDYPHLECPPVFEAETYSLADPPCSRSNSRKGHLK